MALTAFTNKQKGYPVILFSGVPYSAFNFRVYAKFDLSGPYTWVGIVGLAVDAQNYLVARSNGSSVQLCKVAGGVLTIIAEAKNLQQKTSVCIVFIHNNGVFDIYFNDVGYLRTPVLSYRWKESDGALCTSNDLFHIGVYSFIDPPHYRITSFDINNCIGIPFLPGTDSSDLGKFPATGIVDIDNAKYTYTSRSYSGSIPYRGPFQVKTTGSLSYTNSDSGLAFSGKFLEATMFDWTNVRDDVIGYLIATDSKYAWLISDIDRKVYTGSVWTRERARFFCPSKGVVSTTNRAWITEGLMGISVYSTSGSGSSHNMGAICYLDSDDVATLKLFVGSSGDKDATIGDLLESVSKSSGIVPILSGDKITNSITLSSSGTTL